MKRNISIVFIRLLLYIYIVIMLLVSRGMVHTQALLVFKTALKRERFSVPFCSAFTLMVCYVDCVIVGSVVLWAVFLPERWPTRTISHCCHLRPGLCVHYCRFVKTTHPNSTYYLMVQNPNVYLSRLLDITPYHSDLIRTLRSAGRP